MNPQDFINGLIGSIPVSAIALFFVKHFIAGQEKQHDKNRESISAILVEINNLKIKLAEIQGDIKEAISVKDNFRDMEKDVWRLDSQMKAAFKIIDREK